MDVAKLESERFRPEAGHLVTVEVPEFRAARLKAAVLERADLRYGDYDRMSFQSAPGTQSYRAPEDWVLPPHRK